jgi:hypothetical protein
VRTPEPGQRPKRTARGADVLVRYLARAATKG